MTSRIARIEAIPVFSPKGSAADLDGTADTVIVKIFDEDGRYGFGEADAPPFAVKSFIDMPTAHLWSRNAGEILVGEDPVEIAAIWQKLYDGTFWPGRRGLKAPPAEKRFQNIYSEFRGSGFMCSVPK